METEHIDGKEFNLLSHLRLPRALLCSLVGLLWLAAPVSADNDWVHRVGAWLAMPVTVESADAIVVLGGSTGERLPPAIGLYHQGIAPRLWITGAVQDGQVDAGDQSQVALRRAIESGVPTDAISLLSTNNTWTDAQQIVTHAREEGLHSVLVVTSWYHGRRALCALQHHRAGYELTLYYLPTFRLGHAPDDWWQSQGGAQFVTRELHKHFFYMVVYGLLPWRCESASPHSPSSASPLGTQPFLPI